MRTETNRFRARVFRLALVALGAGAAVFLSPSVVPLAFASEPELTCSATCRNGTCSAYGSSCICSCHWWTLEAVCTCDVEKPVQTLP